MKEKILIYGGSGLVGSRFIELFSDQFEIIAPTHQQVDITKPKDLIENIRQVKPGQILYAAGFTNVDLAEEKVKEAFMLNAGAVRIIAAKAERRKIPVHYLSTDYVFNGEKHDLPYQEVDMADPIPAVYAQSKRQGEIETLAASGRNSILRLIMPYSAVYKRKSDLVRLTISRLQSNEGMIGVVDQKINPIFVDDLVNAMALILKKRGNGVYHLGALDYTTPYDFINRIADKFNLDKNLVSGIKFEDFSKTRPALRPQDSWLDNRKFRSEFGEGVLHSLEEGLEFFKRQININ